MGKTRNRKKKGLAFCLIRVLVPSKILAKRQSDLIKLNQMVCKLIAAEGDIPRLDSK